MGKLVLILAIVVAVGCVVWVVVSGRSVAPPPVSTGTAALTPGDSGNIVDTVPEAPTPVQPADVTPPDDEGETPAPVDVADAGNEVPPDDQPLAAVPAATDSPSASELLEKAIAEVPANLQEEVRKFTPPRPLKDRQKDIELLARKGDAQSVEILMALGDARLYLNWAAIEALGRVYTPEVAEYLKGKLVNEDSRIVCSAVQAYGRNKGEEAVPDLVTVLKQNRERPDGFQQEVCSMTAKVMANIGSTAAVPALAEELARYEEKGWNLEYGSVVAASLGRLDTPDARQAISAYADGLSGMIPEDPMAKEYFESKIEEARKAAEGKIDEELIMLR